MRAGISRRQFFRFIGVSILTFGAAPEIIETSRGQGVQVDVDFASGLPGIGTDAKMGISYPLHFPLHTRPMIQAGHHGYWLAHVPMEGGAR